MVFRKFAAVLFINGCFWHRHNCHLFRWPQTRSDFWKDKLNNNADRNQRNQALLAKTWRVGIIWECAPRGKDRMDIEELADQIDAWLSSDSRNLVVSADL
jgi:DNA mismatch endonuclease (patch repair protein)